MAATQIGYVLADDLIFISRITGTARNLGLDVSACRTPAELLRLAQERPAACVIVDLNLGGMVIADLIAELKKTASPFVVGYGSHVQADVLRQARTAGCDVVLPRSEFVAQLQESLPTWFE